MQQSQREGSIRAAGSRSEEKKPQKTLSSSNMMPTVKGMSHMIPSHVLRVGQTICLDPPKETVTHCTSLPKSRHDDPDLDISLENLNQLIMELDPTFELIQDNKSPTCISPPTDASCSDEDVSEVVLIPRGCSTVSSPRLMPSVSPSIPIPTHSGLGCGSHGMLAFSSSPTSSLPPLPFGSAHRRNLSPKNDHVSLRLSRSNRNSTASLLSTSTCSDTSYILGSNLSLAGEDLDPDSMMPGCCSDDSRVKSCDNKHSWEKALMPKRGHLQEVNSRRAQNCPASVSGSLTDIPLLLVNGAPQPDLHCPQPDFDFLQSIPLPKPAHPASQARFNGSQPSMKFVMDTSKFWFRPHISRAEAEALIRDKEAGTFVVRDSTSYRGSFGLAMKVDQTPPSVPAVACPGESSSDLIRHFLIESSAKGVRIKGSSQEPYFGSLSALVYQHTISAYALPCRLRLCCHDLGSAEERSKQRAASEDKHKAAASNFIYLDAVPTETLTGPCAVQKAVSSTLEKAPGSFTPTIVNMKVSLKGVTLTDINRKLFFRRHYPAHLLSYGGEDPDNRVWMRGSSFGARLFGFVAKGVEAGTENVCHVFAEYDTLQDCNEVIEVIQAAVAKP